jgi:hypothetical protein
VSVTTKGFDTFLKRVESMKARVKLDGKTVVVGVLGEKDSDLVAIAAWNEFGTEDGRVPARHFMRTALQKRDLAYYLKAKLKEYALGKVSLDAALAKIGAYTAGIVQRTIGSNLPPPNAPSTIARKKSSRTLINTGRLRQSITWAIR